MHRRRAGARDAHLLIGEAASPELQRSIEAEFEGTPGVSRVIHTLTQHLGPDEVLIAAKLEFEPDADDVAAG